MEEWDGVFIQGGEGVIDFWRRVLPPSSVDSGVRGTYKNQYYGVIENRFYCVDEKFIEVHKKKEY